MMRTLKNLHPIAPALITLTLFSSHAMAAGFEKAQTWSAKAAAQGGAVVGSIAGAEALYFNPAGLVGSSREGEVSLNFSPTLSKFSGVTPYSTLGSVGGTTGFSPVAGIVASFKPMPKLGIGAGYYVSGGTKAKFENLDYSANNAEFNTLKPTVETNLSITEAALGAGYEILPGLRIGAAWRMIKVAAKFSTVLVVPGQALYEVTVDNIEATRWNAYKLGAQYEEPNHRWGLGVDFRSSVQFTAKGDASARRETAAPSSTIQDLGTGRADLDNAFPLQVALGGWTRATELFRIGWEYSFTNYTLNRELAIRGSASNGVTITPLSSIPQHWKNQHIVRLGSEYSGMGLPIRFGYAYTSQVTPSDYARATFSSPGPGHSFTIGSGMILSNNIDVDGALEYSFASGTGHNGTEVPADSDFKSHAYVAHLSAKYRF